MSGTDDSQIVINLATGNSEQNTKSLIDRLDQLFNTLSKLGDAFDHFGEDGKILFKNMVDQAGMLNRVLNVKPSDVSLLNSYTGQAKAVRTALEEASVQALKTAADVQKALSSSDGGQVKAGIEANRRLIDQAQLSIKRLAEAGANLQATDQKAVNRRLRQMEQQLADAVDRERRAEARLKRLQEEDRINAGVASIDRRAAVQDRYANTPQGQAAQLAKDEVAARAENAKRDAAAEREADRAEKTHQNLIVQAQTEDAARTKRAATQAETERRQQPEVRTARLVETQAQLQLQYVALSAIYEGFRHAGEAVVEFDAKLKELQTILGISGGQARTLGVDLLDLSKNSQFSATELLGAANELAKSGLTLAEVGSTVKNASILATATGNSLHQTTELLASAGETFKIGTGEQGLVTDQLYTALNTSRLSIEKLDTAFQGVGVTAKEAGLSFAETTSTLTTLANAGLTSGQALGTGLRQVLTELENPTGNFRKRLDELHISMEAIDVRAHGLSGVFENLRTAGFSASDAFESLQARAATSFVALLNNTDALQSNYTALLNASGAAQAQAQAMDTLKGAAERLLHTFEAIAVNNSGALIGGLKVVANGLTELLNITSGASKTIETLGTVLAALAAGRIISFLIGVAGNFKLFQAGAFGASAALAEVTAAEGAAATASALFGVALSAVGGPIGLTVFALTGLTALYGLFIAGNNDAKAAQDALTERLANSRSALEENSKAVESLNQFIESSINRHADLKDGSAALANVVQDARNKFGALGDTLNADIGTFDQLIGRVKELRVQLNAAANFDLASYRVGLSSQLEQSNNTVARTITGANLTRTLSAAGVNTSTGANFDPSGLGYLDQTGVGTLSKQQQIVNARDKFKGNDKAQALIDILEGKTSAPQDILKAASGALGSTDPGVKALLQGLQPAIDAAKDIGKARSEQARTELPFKATEVAGTQQYAQIETIYQQMQTLIADNKRTIEQTTSAEKRVELTAAFNEQYQGKADRIDRIVGTLPADQQAAFAATDIGKNLGGQVSQGDQIVAATKKYNSDVQQSIEKSTVTLLEADLELLNKDLARERHEKKPTTATVAAIHAKADQIYEDRVKEINSQYDNELRDAAPNTAKRDPQANALERSNAIRAAAAKRDATIEGAETRGEDSPKKAGGQHRDPNLYSYNPPDDAARARQDFSQSDRQFATDIKATSTDIDAQKAFIDAATATKEFPLAVIKQKQQELNLLKAQQEAKQLTLNEDYLAKLQGQMRNIGTSEATLRAAIQTLAAKYGVKVDADGKVIDGAVFTNDQAGRAKQEDFNRQLKPLQSNLGQLTNDQDNRQNKIDSTQNQIARLRAEIDARNAQGNAGIGTAFQSATVGYSDKNNLDASVYTQETQLIGTAFTTLQTQSEKYFDSFIDGSNKGKFSFKQFAASIIQDAAKLLANKAITSLIGQGLNFASGLIGGGGAVSADAASGVGSLGPGGVLGHAYTGAWIKKYDGGVIFPEMGIARYADGGMVNGVDIGRDTVPALLAPGEAVLNKSAAAMVGEDMINKMNFGATTKASSMPRVAQNNVRQETNVYVLDKTTQPSMGPNDVLATIGNNIQQGGAMKQLIKSVVQGSM